MFRVAWMTGITALLAGCSGDSAQTGQNNPPDTVGTKTEAYYNKIIEQQPENAEAYYGRAQHYTAIGHYDRAISDLQHAIQLQPDSGIYVYALADVYLEHEDPNVPLPDSRKALELLSRFSNAHPRSTDAMLELAWVQLVLKQYGELQALMDQALKLDPYLSEAWYYKGMGYAFAGDTAKAVRSLQSAVEIDPQAHWYYELGLLLDRSNPELAMDYYDNAYRLDTTLSDAYYMRGFAYQRTGDYVKAMTIFKDLIKRDKQFSKAHFNMGAIWLEQDSLEKAYRAFDRALGVNPQYVDAYYWRGYVSERQGQTQRAKLDYHQTLNLDPYHRLAADGLDRLKDVE